MIPKSTQYTFKQQYLIDFKKVKSRVLKICILKSKITWYTFKQQYLIDFKEKISTVLKNVFCYLKLHNIYLNNI